MNVPNIIEFILGLGVLILFHELGHFLVARLFKIEIEEFGIGFPPRAMKLFEAGGTEFTLNWIPLGGFVRPKGENDPEVEGGLAAANPWKRLGVLVAGPLMNIGIGVVLAIMIFKIYGAPVPDVVEIKDVNPGSPAAAAGLQANDVVVAVDQQRVATADDVISIVANNADRPLTFDIERAGQPLSLLITPRLNEETNTGIIGVYLGQAVQDVSLANAAASGVEVTGSYIQNLLALPVRMVRGEVSSEEGRPVGYKGMFDIYNYLDNPLYFFMAVSISLGILNLLPIPALDGGRILLTLPEILIRRRIPARYENMIHLVGFTLLILLILYINIQDFINPVTLPQ
jgi:regulator of sigma E protease